MPRPVMLLEGTTLQHAWPRAHATEILIAVSEDIGPMLPAWPASMREDFSTTIARWREHNPEKTIVAMTSACAPDALSAFTATVVLHWTKAEHTGEDHADADKSRT